MSIPRTRMIFLAAYCLAGVVLALVAEGISAAPPNHEQAGQDAAIQEKIDAELAEPFSYFLVPSDMLGFKDCPEGTQVTYDGAFSTGFGELDLYVGSPMQPVDQRVKTLHRGYLPIIEFSFKRDGAKYDVQAFAAPLDLDPRSDLVNFIRVTASNPGTTPVHVGVGAAFVEHHGKARFPQSCEEWYRDRYAKADSFSLAAPFKSEDGLAWQADHLVFTHSQRDGQAASPPPMPDLPEQLIAYEFELPPAASTTIEFKLPYVPVHEDHSAVIRAIAEAEHDDYLARTAAFWEELLSQATGIDVPDPKVVQTMKASLIYDLIARDITEDGQHFIQKVNEFQYNYFFPRDAAYIARTYDMLGLHEIAEQTIEHFLVRDDGGRLKALRRLMPDDWGQTVWAIGTHYRSTGNLEYARRVYPVIPPHIVAFREACKDDPLGLWPAAGPYDNEAIQGHYTGHSFWALAGLQEAIRLAEAVGQPEDANSFRELHDAYRDRFMSRLSKLAAQAEGYIPPGLEDPADGYDWANASGGVYPFGVLSPQDPLVSATVRTIREYKYREGIMTYGPNAWALKQKARRNAPADPGWLHDYETFYVAQTLLARGEQRKVLEDLYSTLAHTSSTHAGFEFSILPWGNRDPGRNYTPHGWFAARYNELLRNMLLREEGQDLHLASALSPVWLEAGKQVRVTNGATWFGPISFVLNARDDGASLDITSAWRDPPNRLVLHVPWYVQIMSAEADGSPVEVSKDVIELPPTARHVELAWQWKERPELSYELAVRYYLNKYHARPPDADYSFLFPTPRPPRIAYDHGIFVGTEDLKLVIPGGIGTIYYTLDGKPADPQATKYTGPIHIAETTAINAITVWDDDRTSEPMEVTLTKVTPRSPDGPAEAQHGMTYSYYEGAWDALPDFDTEAPTRTGRADSLDLAKLQHKDDDYAVRFSGFLEVDRDGVYTFSLGSDDGSKLYIGSDVAVDNDGLHPFREESASIALARGRHAITVEFFERGGADRLSVSYAGPDFSKQVIPAHVLWTASDSENEQ